MITEKNIDNLYRISSNLSFQCFKYANPHPKMTKHGVKFKPYMISEEQREAQHYYSLAAGYEGKITKEQEEEIKAYLLKIKFTRPELLEQTNGNYEQWKRVKIA